jgi:two-component system response regulator RegX3
LRIAILEDDISQMERLTGWLRMAGHPVHCFKRGKELLRALKQETFDVLLLDWNVPHVSGIDVLRQLREQLHVRTPVLVCTARSDEADVVQALRLGADDYITKPLHRLELLWRLEAVCRRDVHRSDAQDFEIGVFRVDGASRRLLRYDEVIEITAKDFDLAVIFLRNVGRLLSRGHLRENVWNSRGVVSSRTLDTHVSRLRSKLLLVPEHGWRLTAIYRHGYRLERLGDAIESGLSKASRDTLRIEQGLEVSGAYYEPRHGGQV